MNQGVGLPLKLAINKNYVAIERGTANEFQKSITRTIKSSGDNISFDNLMQRYISWANV